MKFIVNIVSEQTIPNYLFIREMYEQGDKLLFISSNNSRFIDAIDRICQVLSINKNDVDKIVFQNEGDENSILKMQSQLDSKTKNLGNCLVNLTGGTKLMVIAVKNVFEKYNSKFYYIPLPKNEILLVSSDEEKCIPIKTRLNITEYLSLCNKSYSEDVEPEESYEYCKKMFDWFINRMTNSDREILNLLQSGRPNDRGEVSNHGGYRSCNITISNILHKNETILEDGTCKKPCIPNLQQFLNSISFPLKKEDKLSKEETRFLTGGWLEEYVYYFVKENIFPNDIRLGMKIGEGNGKNEIDVIFTKGNKLYTIECKSGLRGVKLNEIAYKISAIKNSIGALSIGTAFIALDHKEEENSIKMFNEMSKAMNVTYHGSDVLTDQNIFLKKLLLLTKNSND